MIAHLGNGDWRSAAGFRGRVIGGWRGRPSGAAGTAAAATRRRLEYGGGRWRTASPTAALVQWQCGTTPLAVWARSLTAAVGHWVGAGTAPLSPRCSESPPPLLHLEGRCSRASRRPGRVRGSAGRGLVVAEWVADADGGSRPARGGLRPKRSGSGSGSPGSDPTAVSRPPMFHLGHLRVLLMTRRVSLEERSTGAGARVSADVKS